MISHKEGKMCAYIFIYINQSINQLYVSKHYYEREKNMALLLISDYISIGQELPKIMTVDVHF